MPPMTTPEPTLANIMYALARIEGKVDSVGVVQTKQGHDIDKLWSRTNHHGQDISTLKAGLENLTNKHRSLANQQDQSISRGLAVATIVIALLSLVVSFIFNIVGGVPL